MNIRNFIFLGLLSVAFAATSCGNNQTKMADDAAAAGDDMTAEMTDDKGMSGDMAIDIASSAINWTGEMMGMYSHNGDVKLKSGNVVMTDGMISGGSFVADLATINPLDENYGEDNPKEKLVGHLGSPDFFDVANNPEASFEITSAGEGTITGNLTIRGNTHEETVTDVSMTEEGDICTFGGNLTFDRTKYEIAFVHPMQEMIVSNDIKLSISIVTSM